MMQIIIFMIFICVTLLSHNLKANADLYKYVDEEGVVHFSEKPTDERYKLFKKDIEKKGSSVKSSKLKDKQNSKIELPYGRTMGEYCRCYALAIEAAAQARDNLCEPSWDELVKKNPVLEKKGKKNIRAILYAHFIYMSLSEKNASPLELKKRAFENCLYDRSSCFHFGVGCPK